MFKKLFLILVSFSLLAGSILAQKDTDKKHFGEIISADNAVAFDDVIEKMKTTDSLQVKLVGTVYEVCQAKGCWMNLKSETSGEELFVRFKDYGFFMPKDIAGRKVVIEGYSFPEVISVEELRHYAEDKGSSEEEIAKITEPEESLNFLASGVLLLDK